MCNGQRVRRGQREMIGAAGAAIAGLVVLVVASGRLVTASAALALRLRVPTVVVGAVVIGFGTSTPELVTSALAAAEGSRDIAVGNVVGSNVANLTLVLGVVALVATPAISSRVLRRELPAMVGAMLILAVALRSFDRWTAIVLVTIFAMVMTWLLRTSSARGDTPPDAVDPAVAPVRRRWRLVMETAGGLVGTVVGAQLLVSGARALGERAEVGEGLVGFTLVALGTSLPELSTGVQAGRRGDADLVIGNLMGSNLFNSLAIAGVSGFSRLAPFGQAFITTAWVAALLAAAVGVLMVSCGRLTRWEGSLLVAAYAAMVAVVA